MKAKPVPEAVFSNSLVRLHSICTGIGRGIVRFVIEEEEEEEVEVVLTG